MEKGAKTMEATQILKKWKKERRKSFLKMLASSYSCPHGDISRDLFNKCHWENIACGDL